jgi:hypothetical protein
VVVVAVGEGVDEGLELVDLVGECEFRRNPARDSDLMSATVPI